jgi:hypothetical protein
MKNHGGVKVTGKTEELLKTSSVTLSTTNPKRVDPGTNPGLSGEMQAANSLSHGTAFF